MFTETKYGIDGKELEDINGAIADNAVDSARKAMGADHLPKTADDKRKRDMIAKVLNSLQKYDAALPEGTLVAPVQVRKSAVFDQLEAKLADALNLVDDEITHAVTAPAIIRKTK
jgi:hypothetical protein